MWSRDYIEVHLYGSKLKKPKKSPGCEKTVGTAKHFCSAVSRIYFTKKPRPASEKIDWPAENPVVRVDVLHVLERGVSSVVVLVADFRPWPG